MIREKEKQDNNRTPPNQILSQKEGIRPTQDSSGIQLTA